MSAFHPIADIKLILAKRAANDPKWTCGDFLSRSGFETSLDSFHPMHGDP